MPDARFPDRWLNDRRIARLSDTDFRSFVVSLAWSVSNRTDGHIEADDLPLIAAFQDSSVRALTDAGLWILNTEAEAWRIAEFDSTQTSKAQLEGLDHKRQQDRDRQARKRARDNGHEPPPSRDSREDITREVARETKARPGKARTGLDREADHDDDDDDQQFIAAPKAAAR